MIDFEINQYLSDHNWSVNVEDCAMKMFNTSYQIIDIKYDFKTGLMTIVTTDNITILSRIYIIMTKTIMKKGQ